VLREPIARWISYVRYYGALTQPGRPLTLREYAEEMLGWPETSALTMRNGQTNFLAEHEWYRLQRSDVVAIDWTAEPELFAQYRRERLAFALDLLQRFGVVGTVERLGDFTRVLTAQAARWDTPLLPTDGLPPTLVTDAPAVDASWITPRDSVGRRLLEAFAEDFELYRYADQRLRADLASLGSYRVAPR